VRLGEAADRDFKTCSTGMRQRLAIARALLHRPRTLFLDEPTRGLDPPAVRALHRLIREELTTRQGITVFLTTHWLQEAEKLCDRVAIMHKGRIRGCGTMSELRTLIGETERYRIRVGGLTPASRAHPEQNAVRQPAGGRYTPVLSETNVIPNDESILNRTIDAIRATGGTIQSLTLEQVPLETIFDRLTVGSEQLPVSSYQSAVGSQPTNQSPITNPQFPSFPRIALAFLKRDWRGEASYRLSFLLQFASVFFSVAVFYFVAQLLGEAAAPLLASYGGDYFAFVLIGIAFARYFGVGMSGFANSLRRAQTVGTLEAMLTTPTRLSAIILSSSLWSYGITTLQVLAYLVAGAVFLGVQLGRGNYAAALLVLILTIGVFNSLGILAASFIMVLKRGDPVTWIFNALFTFFGGVYYPIAVLPDWLEPVSNLLPVTYGLRAMRLALLQGASFGDLLPDILALALFSIALLPLSLLAFRYAVRRARVDGSLTHY
ncbi:MAG: ABC transporter permease, partial [Anaerolineales bacterium]